MLRLQFLKSLRRGYAKNAELDPEVALSIVSGAEDNETFDVRVDSTKGDRYWFSDRRLLRENADGVYELLRYAAVTKVHWMFKDSRLQLSNHETNAVELKRNHFDRLEIELLDGLVVLEGLDQAYDPLFRFFRWISLRRTPDRNREKL